MTKRRPLTEAERADAERLKAVYKQKKAEYRLAGKRLTQESMAGELGWSGQTAVSQYMAGNIPLNLEAAAMFARFFNVSLEKISPRLANLLPNASDSEEQQGNSRLSSDDTERVPLISWMEAGVTRPTAGDHASETRILCPVPHSNRTFALVVEGEAMTSPGNRYSFDDGDIIHVDPAGQPRQGSIVLVRNPQDEMAILRQLMIDGGRRYLKALNPAWPDAIIEFPPGAHIVGVVICKTVSFAA